MSGLYRRYEQFLARWFAKKKRKPLVIRGARQVGKSTLVRRFAQHNKLSLLEVNLEQHRELSRVFVKLDPRQIIAELEAIAEVRVDTDVLVFLDEIQATPPALAALRYLYEQYPSVPVIAAGSLLEFTLKDYAFSMPVGRVEYLHMGPMSFGEFLFALGKHVLADRLSEVEAGEALPQAMHEKLLALQRQFLLVGGMPEAVAEYARTGSMVLVGDVQQSILSTYKDDFNKYARGDAVQVRLSTVFHYVPGAIGSKIKYTSISREDRSRELKAAIHLLSLARVILSVYHSDCSGLLLESQKNLAVYKCLFLDVGLMNRLLGLDERVIRSWDERSLINEGGLAEQFVGQHLFYRGEPNREPNLHYWLREGKANNAEVDYVIAHGGRVVPIEVKAGRTGSLRSLHQFVRAKSSALAVRFDLGQPSLQDLQHPVRVGTKTEDVSYRLLGLPLYLVEQLERLLSQLRS